jgi:hypothetical protein
MNIINNWILKRADRIKAEKEAKVKAQREMELANYNRGQEIRREAKKSLMASLQPHIDAMENQECHIKPGDETILNKYGMIHKHCFNGWDSGPTAFLNHCKEEDKTTPVICDILSIYVDTSLADERIDNWIANRSNQELESMLKTPGVIFAEYHKHATRLMPKGIAFGEKYGLYKTAMFKAQFSKFNPKWGLNVGSFLEINTPEAQETKQIWLEEISLDFARKQLKEQTDKIDARKREIDEKYRGIKYAN